ncbi:MAG: ATP12 family protein [Alphaproteobacteria bacterium]
MSAKTRTVDLVKRFYKDVAAAPSDDESAFEVHLDARGVRTPMRRPLQVPGPSLADAIADEWRAQAEEIDVETMPLTRIAATAVDRVADDREGYIDQIAAYGATDLVCYRAQTPAELVIRQSKAWQPLLDWARDTFGSELVVTDGLLPVDQPPESLAQLRGAVAAHDDYELAALGVATSASGSIIVALALSKGHLDSATAFDIGQLDESYQVELWGEEAEAQARRDVLRADIECAASFLELLRRD